MKILWIKSDFLHPTTRGGQIRTLETLRRLSARHEVHYAAYEDPESPEGPRRAHEYCARSYAVKRSVPPRGSARFAIEAAVNLLSSLPLPVSRYRSREMRRLVARLVAEEKFDSVVCDFLMPAPDIPDLSRTVLFEHNVEYVIMERHALQAGNPLARAYFDLQARRMKRLERWACREAGHVIAVSDLDAATIRKEFGATRVSAVPTGVDLDYFARPAAPEHRADLVFTGSMDWMPNVDGALFFVNEVFPLILKTRPETTFAIVGRKPAPEISRLAEQDTRIVVTGTVPDVRPFLWGSTASIVPLRIGGGTRLKIYESMAARVPVVSTSIGAEGLAINPPEDIRIADSPAAFAAECLDMLENSAARQQVADAAWEMVSRSFSWDRVVEEFERVLRLAPYRKP